MRGDIFKHTDEQARLERPFGWIQWKGTNVCIDLHCECGAHGHVDAEFLYFVRCEDRETAEQMATHLLEPRVPKQSTLFEKAKERASRGTV